MSKIRNNNMLQDIFDNDLKKIFYRTIFHKYFKRNVVMNALDGLNNYSQMRKHERDIFL